MSEVEETIKRIQAHKGVIGIIVVNSEGIPIRTTMDSAITVTYAGLIHQLNSKARSTVRDMDPSNDLTFLRLRSKKHEIMVAPEAHSGRWGGLVASLMLYTEHVKEPQGLFEKSYGLVLCFPCICFCLFNLCLSRVLALSPEEKSKDKEYLLIVIQNPCE